MYYVITPMQGPTDAAEIKPKTDVAVFLDRIGMPTLEYSRFVHQDDFWRDQLLGMLARVQRNDTVIYQTPTYAGQEVEAFIVKRLHKVGAKMVALVHDLDYLRFPRSHPKGDAIDFLNQFDVLMIGTVSEQQLLQLDGVTVPSVVIGPWGYVQTVKYVQPGFSRAVHFAGNLTQHRAGFLAHVPGNLNVDAYGSNDGAPKLDFDVAPTVTLHGVLTQFALGTTLNNGFGLVWDGPDADDVPDYAYYNMPHKLSLYLAQGLPVLARRGTAVGRYIQKSHVGYVADDLDEMSHLLTKVDTENYTAMVERVRLVADVIRSGRTIQAAALRAVMMAAGM